MIYFLHKAKNCAPFRQTAVQKLVSVSETKLAAITVDGGKGKGSAFKERRS